MPSTEHDDIVAMLSNGVGLEGLSVEEQREMMEASAELFPPADDVVTEEVDANGVPAEWVSIGASEASVVVLYFHGGAYVMGSRNTHRGLAGRIAQASKGRILVPDYRLAPENPFPAAVDDALTCWHWLLDQGQSPQNMIIAGDSAGGGLALATLLALKDAGKQMPCCAVAMSPWTDLEGQGASAVQEVVDDPMLTLDGLRTSGKQYAEGNLRNPLAAPLHGDLAGLPPLLIQVGTREILLSDSTRIAEKAKAAGVDVSLEVEDGLIHVWQMFAHVPEAQSAVERIGAFIKAKHQDH